MHGLWEVDGVRFSVHGSLVGVQRQDVPGLDRLPQPLGEGDLDVLKPPVEAVFWPDETGSGRIRKPGGGRKRLEKKRRPSSTESAI